MNLNLLIRKVLWENVNPLLIQLKEKYVGEGKLFSENEFKQLEDFTSNKWYLIAWLTKKVASNIIKKEDLYKWKEYFQIFDKNKKKFKFQDINLFKTPEDIQNFIETAIQIREGDLQFEDLPTSNSFLSKSEIEKLTSGGGNKYLGLYNPQKGLKPAGANGYQVFQITSPTKDNWKIYRDLLGRCKGRNRGAKIEICTIGDFRYFRNYLKDDEGSSYFVLFNLNDPLSPYQLHVESNQFMNKNDVERFNFDKDNFLKWLSEKSEYYNSKKIAIHMGKEIPHENKGFENENGKQGLWEKYEDGKLESIETYVNNKTNGPAIYFWRNGNVRIKGSYKGNRWVGDFEEYNYGGELIEKGFFDSRQQPIGVWKYKTNTTFKIPYLLRDRDNPQALVSGVTKNGDLRVLSDNLRHNDFTGKVTFLNPSGSPKALGRLTPLGKKTGQWTIFDGYGSIKVEGNFRNDKPAGKWTFISQDKGVKHLYTINFDQIDKKGKLYDKDGNFIEKFEYSNKIHKILEKLFDF